MNKTASTKPQVRIVNPSISEDDHGNIIIRGVLSPDSIKLLKVDAYQREQLTRKKIDSLTVAVCNDTVPDIELSWRGREDYDLDENGAVLLAGSVYVVDGQQRRAAALQAIANGHSPHLGAAVFLGKDKTWEKERFLILNMTQTQVGANVILRNLADDYPGVKNMLYMSTQDDNFVLKGKVSWDQYMRSDHLLRATTLINSAVQLHRHIINGEMVKSSGGTQNLARNIDKIFNATKQDIVVRKNTERFFAIIDEAWGIRNIKRVSAANQIKSTFLFTLASVLSTYTNFWHGNELVIDKATIKKLATFDLNENQVANLIRTGGNRLDPMLFQLLVFHINSGRRSGRLKSRFGFDMIPTDVGFDEDEI